MNYIKQLDSLRAIAVTLVIISHWIPSTFLINKLPNGSIGVDIFFVLSGFLISRILFDNRNKAEQFTIPKSTLLKNFYLRRTLRIFPIYYLTIFLLLFFEKRTGTHMHNAFPYLVTYTSNFYFIKIHGWDGVISHLWSLAVEEQFYLLWPWLILFVNKKYLFHTIIGFILIGVISPYFLRHVDMKEFLTFTCFDAFGMGALLAWQITYAKDRLKQFYFLFSILSAIAFCLFVIGVIRNHWFIFSLRTLVSVITAWLICYIYINTENNTLKFKFILNNTILIFLGKISYGIYLYHNIIPATLNSRLINKHLNPLLPDLLYKKYWGILYLVENIILLLVISWLSYILIEKRFLNLKKYFEYSKETDTHKVTLSENIVLK